MFFLNTLVFLHRGSSTATAANHKVHSTLAQSSPHTSPPSVYSRASNGPTVTNTNATFIIDASATGTDFASVFKCGPYCLEDSNGGLQTCTTEHHGYMNS